MLAGLRAALCGLDGATEALSSLAVGADHLFAGLALDCGAELTAVSPSGDYEAAQLRSELLGELARRLGEEHPLTQAARDERRFRRELEPLAV